MARQSKPYPAAVALSVMDILAELDTLESAILVMRREGIDNKNIAIIGDLCPIVIMVISRMEKILNTIADDYTPQIGRSPKWSQVLGDALNYIDDVSYYIDSCKAEYRDKNWQGVKLLLDAAGDVVEKIRDSLKSVPIVKKTSNDEPVTFGEVFGWPVAKDTGQIKPGNPAI